MADLVTLTIDDRKIEVPKGTLVVDAAAKLNIDIPIFCSHPKLDPVACCRMCLVEISGPRGMMLQTACSVPVAQDMVVKTNTEAVKDMQEANLAFLLLNHPLDCPICDKGGECPLQNLTLRHGPGQSRFLFGEKMHFEKHVPLGRPEEALIYLDRERCIQCARCTRFCDEIADDHVLGFYERGRRLEIVTFSEPGFDSKFSGNTTDICPVGALTTADFRFGARPWELTPAASVCSHCPVGCNLTLSTRREAKSGGQPVIKRVLPRQNEQVNEIWLCDKGRFGHHFVESAERLTTPLVRKNGQLAPATWDEALALAGEKLQAAGAGLRTLVGDRLSNEDLYALQRVTAGLGGAAWLNTAMGGGEQVQQAGVAAGTQLGALGKGSAILVVASDLEEEAPVWWLRIKQAAERGATLIVANARATKLDRHARYKVRYDYGHEAAAVLGMLVAGSSEAAEAFAKATDAVVVFGREGLDVAGSTALAQACANLLTATGHTGRPNNGLIAVWPGANTQGAWELGLRPAASPAEVWAGARAAWIAGADPVGDGALSAAALRQTGFVVVQELFRTATAEAADVVLPAAAWAEREGTYTSGERRVQRFYPAVPARGRADCEIAAQIGARVGVDLPRFPSQLFLEIARNVPAFAGLTYARLAEVTPQWPDVGGRDLYYGGTSHTNAQGLGVALTTAAERGAPAAAQPVEVPHRPAGLLLVPITVLYDRGAAFAPSTLMHPRVPQPYVVLHAADAAALGVQAGAPVEVRVNDLVFTAAARVAAADADLTPAGAVLLPRGLGVPAPAGPAAVQVRPLQGIPEAVR